jgi:hypothetical protein
MQVIKVAGIHSMKVRYTKHMETLLIAGIVIAILFSLTSKKAPSKDKKDFSKGGKKDEGKK